MVMPIQTEFGYIKFDQVPNPGRKTDRWVCRNKTSGDIIGMVGWYPEWRRYAFWPERFREPIFSAGCLIDIADFINQAMRAYKSKGK